MVNDYNHGRMQEEEGYGMEEYEMPPEPPIPEPIIPTAMYYDLPAGLMAPLVGVRFLSVIILLEGGDREGVVRWLWAACETPPLFLINNIQSSKRPVIIYHLCLGRSEYDI